MIEDRERRHQQHLAFIEAVIQSGLLPVTLNSARKDYLVHRQELQNWAIVFMVNPEVSYQTIAESLGITRQAAFQGIKGEITRWWKYSSSQISNKYRLSEVTDFTYRRGVPSPLTKKVFSELDAGKSFEQVASELKLSANQCNNLRYLLSKYDYHLPKSKSFGALLEDNIKDPKELSEAVSQYNPRAISRYKRHHPEQRIFTTLWLALSEKSRPLSKRLIPRFSGYLRNQGIVVLDEVHPRGMMIHHIFLRDQEKIQQHYNEWIAELVKFKAG